MINDTAMSALCVLALLIMVLLGMNVQGLRTQLRKEEDRYRDLEQGYERLDNRYETTHPTRMIACRNCGEIQTIVIIVEDT